MRLRAWASLVILPNRVSLPLSLQSTEDFVRKLLPEQASCCVQCATFCLFGGGLSACVDPTSPMACRRRGWP